MKTFRELFESTENEYVFSSPYRYHHDVPDFKKTYKPAVEKELIRLLRPISDAWNMTIDEIKPYWTKTTKSIISGELVVIVKYVNLMNNGHVIGKFFNSEDAMIARKPFEDSEIFTTSTASNFKIEKPYSGLTIDLDHLHKLAKKKNIEIDLDEIKAFSQQCFYEEGPLWDAFAKEKRGSLAANKFGQ